MPPNRPLPEPLPDSTWRGRQKRGHERRNRQLGNLGGGILGSWNTIATTDTEMPGLPGVAFRGDHDFDRQGIYRTGGGRAKVAGSNDSVIAKDFPADLFTFAVAVDGLEVASIGNNGQNVLVADTVTDDLRTALRLGDVCASGEPSTRSGRTQECIQTASATPTSR